MARTHNDEPRLSSTTGAVREPGAEPLLPAAPDDVVSIDADTAGLMTVVDLERARDGVRTSRWHRWLGWSARRRIPPGDIEVRS